MGFVATTRPELESKDNELLNAVQWDFPRVIRPYAALGERLGMTEAEVMERVAEVKRGGVLRQLSAIFDTRALGYGSSLVACKVDPERIDAAAAVISAHPGVSHNYKRNHAFNLWYTVAVPPGHDLETHVDVLHRDLGAEITRILPTLELFKIGVKLDMTGKTRADAKAEVLDHERPERKPDMQAPELSDLEVATIRVVQEDLPLVAEPFGVQADQVSEVVGAAVGGEDVLELIESFRERGLMRRFAAVMNHRQAGFKANAMGVWAVPEDQLDEIGPRMAGFAAVSHCYRRPTYPDWPYSVFTMAHGRSKEECDAILESISESTGITERATLYSSTEYKKVRMLYFTDDFAKWEREHGA